MKQDLKTIFSKDNLKKEALSIPNVLTYLRIGGSVAFFIYLASFGLVNPLLNVIIAASLGLTDLADGYIARKYHMETKLGGVIDPIADKIFNWGIGLTLIAKGIMPLWPLVIGARDIVVASITKHHLNETGKPLKPTWLAKFKMGFQSIGTVATLAFGFGLTGPRIIAPIAMGCAVFTMIPESFAIRKKIKQDKEEILLKKNEKSSTLKIDNNDQKESCKNEQELVSKEEKNKPLSMNPLLMKAIDNVVNEMSQSKEESLNLVKQKRKE